VRVAQISRVSWLTTSLNGILFHNFIVPQVLKKLPAIYEIRMFITMFSKTCQWSISRESSKQVFTYTHPCSLPKWPLPLGFSDYHYVCIYHVPRVWYPSKTRHDFISQLRNTDSSFCALWNEYIYIYIYIYHFTFIGLRPSIIQHKCF
jgi:hypothetical protein